MSHDISLFGVGAQTPIGRSAPASAASVRAGITRAQEHAHWRDHDGEPVVEHRARWLPDTPDPAHRMLALATEAALESLSGLQGASAAGLSPADRQLGVYVGLPELRPGLTPSTLETFQQSFSEQLRLGIAQVFQAEPEARWELTHVTILPHGHASGIEALEKAVQSLRTGQETFCLVGGVDSYLHPDTVAWLDSHEQLHGVDNAWGLAPGEGAGFCLLASRRIQEQLLARLQRKPLARIRAVTLAQEPHRIKTQSICTGEGLTQAFHSVLKHLQGEQVDQLVIDLNGEVYQGEELGFASVRTGEHFAALGDLLAPSTAWGDVGAASGPLFIALAVQAGARGWSRGVRWLVSTSSEGGLRGVALLELEPGLDSRSGPSSHL